MAIIASPESQDNVWLIKVKDIDYINLKDVVDDYGHVILAGEDGVKQAFFHI